LSSYSISIHLAPEDIDSWNGKAKCLRALGRDGDAEDAFRNAKRLEIKKSNAERPIILMLPKIINDIKSVLERKGQIILYGPPGTGKTFWALKAARDLAANS
jgi:DNA replication protein DnaC